MSISSPTGRSSPRFHIQERRDATLLPSRTGGSSVRFAMTAERENNVAQHYYRIDLQLLPWAVARARTSGKETQIGWMILSMVKS